MDQARRHKEHHEHAHETQDSVHLNQAQEGEHREREPVGHEHEHSGQVMPQEHHAQQHEHRAPHSDGVTVFIDHKPYTVASARVTGAELRKLSDPPIGADKHIFHVVSGKSADVKIGDADVVEIDLGSVEHGRHFYSAGKALAVPSEDLAKRAYFMYLDQGSRNGHDVEHWLAAEKQMAGRTSS
jgi:hypothetical protein